MTGPFRVCRSFPTPLSLRLQTQPLWNIPAMMLRIFEGTGRAALWRCGLPAPHSGQLQGISIHCKFYTRGVHNLAAHIFRPSKDKSHLHPQQMGCRRHRTQLIPSCKLSFLISMCPVPGLCPGHLLDHQQAASCWWKLLVRSEDFVCEVST